MSDHWTGYELPESAATFDALREGFEWEIPGRYNIAEHVFEGDSSAVALRHVPEEMEGNGPRTVTYGALDEASAAVATQLAADGVSPGDRVAVCLPQCPEQVVVHLAVYRLGGVVVPASMLLGDAVLDHLLTHADVDALFVDERRWARADEGEVETVGTTVTVDVDADRSALAGLAPYAGDVDEGEPPPVARTGPEDPAIVLYTSGTTSEPKGVVQSHQYLLGSLPGYHCWFDLFDPESSRETRVWTPSEWAWAGALFDVVFPTLALGGTVVSSVRRSGFDPERALALVESHAVTHAFFPPTALRKLRQGVESERVSTPSLSAVMSGGEALPDPVAEWAETTLGATVNESYGQTEANALAGESNARYPSTGAGLGRPYPGHDVAIVDDDGSERPAGEVGEIAVSLPDPVVMRGYLDDPDATRAVLCDEWLRTGDLGRVTAEGDLEHLGRTDELIVSSGYRISPLEVESALLDHPAVSAALVGSEPDSERGQRVVAKVVSSAESMDEATLRARLRAHVADSLGPYKRPHVVEFVSELPTTRTGKTDRSRVGGSDDQS